MLVIVFVTAYYPVLSGLVRTWHQSEDASHGFFIIPIALYIVWRDREVLREMKRSPSLWGLGVVIVSLLCYILSRLAQVVTISSITLIFTLAGMVIFLFGFPIFRRVLFAIVLLFLMIPVPSQIYSSMTMPLQLIVSTVATEITSLLGVTVFREGNVIQLPERTFEVVQACSGLRSIMTLLTLGAIYGYFTLESQLLRGILFVSALPIAIAVNVIRIVVMVLAAHFANFDLTAEPIHTWYGLAIFGLAFFIFLLVQKLLSFFERPTICAP